MAEDDLLSHSTESPIPWRWQRAKRRALVSRESACTSAGVGSLEEAESPRANCRAEK